MIMKETLKIGDMLIFTDINGKLPLKEPVIMTMGNFDGLHRGHKRIIRKVTERAKEKNGTSLLITFEPHPLKVLHPEKAPALIKTKRQKREILAHLGINVLWEIPFNKSLAKLSPHRFLERVLFASVKPAEIYIGEGFKFGKDRKGDITFLKKAEKKLNFVAFAIPKITIFGIIVSSSIVRKAISDGKIEDAIRYLGRPYYMIGIVAKGDERGSTLGFPTANLIVENELWPKLGVYVVAVEFEGGMYPAVANIGTRPTFNLQKPTIEVYLLNFSKDLYGKELKLYFLKFLRDEVHFPDRKSLIKAIESDVETAKSYFSSHPLPAPLLFK